MQFASGKTVLLLLATSFFCTAAEFRVKPGDKSFAHAAKNWKKGDIILLAPGTYYNYFKTTPKERAAVCGLTIKAEIPGTAHLRGDRPSPVFLPHAKGIWKAQWKSIPETVFEHDTLTPYKYAATLTGLQNESGTWTYDAKTKTLYIRTTDSGDPAHHALTVGVTPKPGINIYCSPNSTGAKDILVDGVVVTGFYSRCSYPDQRVSSHSQHGMAWGIVVNHPTDNVRISNSTAVLNGNGIGFCAAAKNSVIENCRAWGNQNPFYGSGGGIGIFSGADNCIVRGNIGGDNSHNDVWLYSGPITPTTVFAENKAYGNIRTKAGKQKGFEIHNSIAQSFGFIGKKDFISNCVSFGFDTMGNILKEKIILLRYEKDLNPDQIFADPSNLDCRTQGDVAPDIAKRGLTFSNERIFYWKQNGKDSANGRSVKNAFSSFGRVLQELSIPETEIYIEGTIKGDLNLKGLKNIAIRGRGAFPVTVQGKVVLENCSCVKLERLAPAEFAVHGGKDISIHQCAGKISADEVSGLRVTHNYIQSFALKNCMKSFITANVFEKTQITGFNGWSDYNAYVDKVPAGEKNSFKAQAQLGKNFTFRNAWQFDGRAIDSMPVGPYRRQHRNVQFVINEPAVQQLAPDTVVVKLSANIPFSGVIRWGASGSGKVNEVKLPLSANTHAAALTGLKSGQKYYFQFKVSTDVPKCFSNAELKHKTDTQKAQTKQIEFTTPDKIQPAREYFAAKDGSDLNDGSKDKPFGTISYAVTKLHPGDTLTIRGGTYDENFSVQVSGTKEKPIVIQGAPGEKVYLQAGPGAPLAGGISVTNQHYIHFKNFYIYGDRTVSTGFSAFVFRTINCRGLHFEKLLVCGTVHKIHAENCPDIVVEDCGFTGGHEGVTFNNCSNLVIRNCTFAHAGVMHLTVRNTKGESVLLENCIFTDAINKKGFGAVIMVADISKLTERNNCFFNRMPFDQKPLIGWHYEGSRKAVQNVKDASSGGFPYNGRRQLPYPAYQKELNRPDTGSFSANPGLKVFPDYTAKYKSFADWEANWKKSETKSNREGHILRNHPELLRDLKNYLPTNPEVIKRGCGPRL